MSLPTGIWHLTQVITDESSLEWKPWLTSPTSRLICYRLIFPPPHHNFVSLVASLPPTQPLFLSIHSFLSTFSLLSTSLHPTPMLVSYVSYHFLIHQNRACLFSYYFLQLFIKISTLWTLKFSICSLSL